MYLSMKASVYAIVYASIHVSNLSINPWQNIFPCPKSGSRYKKRNRQPYISQSRFVLTKQSKVNLNLRKSS